MAKTTKKAIKANKNTTTQARAITSETTTAPVPVPVAVEAPTRKLVVEDYADQPKAPPTPVVSTEPTPAPASPAPAKPEVVKPSKSTVEKPTKAVWAIADEMRTKNPQATRKEIVDECIRRGIAFYTARTQYQRWSKTKAS